ncbi:MAG: OmpA family protein [Methylococcales bacterium]|nr:OmpA family protein [Methylococcaceae bacterium]
MKTRYICLPLVVLAASLVGCATPKKDTSALKSEIDAAYSGHYGQSLRHEELAEEKLKTANRILKHWEKDYYWNIDEQQKALDAAKEAAHHRLESEKELCQWLTEVHGPNHHQHEDVHHVAAYFKTGIATPFKINDVGIGHIGHYLHEHPDAKADLIASADTVGSSTSNQHLSDKRAESVKKLLIEHGAKAEQLNIKSIGEGPGPDKTPNQENRIVTISTTHPSYIDCPNLK